MVQRRADIVAEMGEEAGLGTARGLGAKLLFVIAPGQQALLFADRGQQLVGAATFGDIHHQGDEAGTIERALFDEQGRAVLAV